MVKQGRPGMMIFDEVLPSKWSEVAPLALLTAAMMRTLTGSMLSSSREVSKLPINWYSKDCGITERVRLTGVSPCKGWEGG